LGQKFKEYQDILHLLSNFYEKIPPEIEQKRRYYCTVYTKCVFEVKNLLTIAHKLLRLGYDDSSTRKKIESSKTTYSYALYQLQNYKNSKNKFLMIKDELKKHAEKLGNYDEVRVNENLLCLTHKHIIETKSIKGVRTLSSKIHKRNDEVLDREELSDLTESDDEKNEESCRQIEKCQFINNENRVDCCYEKIQLRKTNKRTSWHNKISNGIMLIDGCEFVFNEALMNLTWLDE